MNWLTKRIEAAKPRLERTIGRTVRILRRAGQNDFEVTLGSIVTRLIVLGLLVFAAFQFGRSRGPGIDATQAELCLPASAGDDDWINRIGTPPVVYDRERAMGERGNAGPLRPDCRIQVLDSGLADARGLTAVAGDTAPDHFLIVGDAWEGLYKYSIHGRTGQTRPIKLPNIEVCPRGHCADVEHGGLISDTSTGQLLLVETHQQRISIREANGKFVGTFGDDTPLEGVTDVAQLDKDTLVVTTAPRASAVTSASSPVGRVVMLRRHGEPTTLPGAFERPIGIAYSECPRRIYVADAGRLQTVWYFYEDQGAGWKLAGVLGSQPSLDSMIPVLLGIAVAPCADQGTTTTIDATIRGGEIFAAGPGGLFVFHPDGALLARYILSEPIGGLTWGVASRQDDTMLYMTVGHRIARVRTNVKRSPDREPAPSGPRG